MEMVKTASFEYLMDLAEKNPDGGYTFILDGTPYQIEDVLEISKIATDHGYIVIYRTIKIRDKAKGGQSAALFVSVECCATVRLLQTTGLQRRLDFQ